MSTTVQINIGLCPIAFFPETQEVLDGKDAASVVVGPAGENLARFANMASGRCRCYGTNAHVRPCLKNRILPVNNFQDGWHELGDQVAGEVMAEKHRTKHHACKPCTIL